MLEWKSPKYKRWIVEAEGDERCRDSLCYGADFSLFLKEKES
jgi:hypothetical protein